ncbi:MAG: S-layer homology domain-containing protein, partial [Anaerovorax sp.]|nr:S-layer homology domain-containing protein [Anaerovorax sp.]
ADDTAVAPYAKDAVILMQKGGIISGIKQEDGSYKFAPKANATRAEAATMIFKYSKTK